MGWPFIRDTFFCTLINGAPTLRGGGGRARPPPSIRHKRVPNLRVFFQKFLHPIFQKNEQKVWGDKTYFPSFFFYDSFLYCGKICKDRSFDVNTTYWCVFDVYFLVWTKTSLFSEKILLFFKWAFFWWFSDKRLVLEVKLFWHEKHEYNGRNENLEKKIKSNLFVFFTFRASKKSRNPAKECHLFCSFLFKNP